jgi:hypothetical protein
MRSFPLPLLLLANACGASPTAAPAHSLPDNQTAPADAEDAPAVSVRSIDWKNRTYRFPSEDEGGDPLFAGEYPVIDGVYNWDRGNGDHGWFAVENVVYGDVDDDGSDDAIVTVRLNGGGSGKFDSALVFVAREDAVVWVGDVPGGDRASGGLRDVRVVDGRIVVQRFLSNSACCPEKLQIELWSFNGTAVAEDPSARKLAPVPD